MKLLISCKSVYGLTVYVDALTVGIIEQIPYKINFDADVEEDMLIDEVPSEKDPEGKGYKLIRVTRVVTASGECIVTQSPEKIKEATERLANKVMLSSGIPGGMAGGK